MRTGVGGMGNGPKCPCGHERTPHIDVPGRAFRAKASNDHLPCRAVSRSFRGFIARSVFLLTRVSHQSARITGGKGALTIHATRVSSASTPRQHPHGMISKPLRSVDRSANRLGTLLDPLKNLGEKCRFSKKARLFWSGRRNREGHFHDVCSINPTVHTRNTFTSTRTDRPD